MPNWENYISNSTGLEDRVAIYPGERKYGELRLTGSTPTETADQERYRMNEWLTNNKSIIGALILEHTAEEADQ